MSDPGLLRLFLMAIVAGAGFALGTFAMNALLNVFKRGTT